MNRHVKSASVILCLMALSACQNIGAGKTMSNEEEVNATLDKLNVTLGEPVRSVSNYMINGWHEVNEQNLIIISGVDDHYLITLGVPCMELSYAFSIRLDTAGSSLTRGDSVVVYSLHRPVERCMIREIYRLVDRDDTAD